MEIQVNRGHGQPLEWHTCRVGPKQWWGCSLMRSSGLMREWLSRSNTWLSPRLHVCGCILFVLSCVFFQVTTWHYFTKKIATVSIRCSPRLLELKAMVSEAAAHLVFTQWTWSVCSRALTRLHSWPHHYDSTCAGQATVDAGGQSSLSTHHDLSPRRLLLMDSCSS